MFGHLPELLIIMVIGLVVFGPEKLPEVAANAGRMMRDIRQTFDTAMNPADASEVEPDDFTQYYYESLARSGETMPETPQNDEDDLHEWQDGTSEHESQTVEGDASTPESVAESGTAGVETASSPAAKESNPAI